MATVVLDIIEGADVRETRDGYEATRTIIVQTDAGSESARLYEALSAPDVPKRGDAHPTIPGLRVDSRQAAAIGVESETVRITCNYRQLTESDIAGSTPSIAVGSVVVSETTSRDASGNIVATTETKARVDADGNVTGVDILTRPLQIQVQRPLMTYNVRRKETTSPEAKAQKYVGTAGSFTKRPESSANWLCTRIEGSSSDGGVTYDVDYEFTHNPEGWDAKIETFWHKNVLTSGELDSSVLSVQVYRVVSFAPLGLPAPSTVGVG